MRHQTVDEIWERIRETIICTAPESMETVPVRIRGYLDRLYKVLSSCNCPSGLCGDCQKLQAALVKVWVNLNYITSKDGAVRKVLDGIVWGERRALAWMIEHNPSQWSSASEVASAVREGRRCHPECTECELEKEV